MVPCPGCRDRYDVPVELFEEELLAHCPTCGCEFIVGRRGVRYPVPEEEKKRATDDVSAAAGDSGKVRLARLTLESPEERAPVSATETPLSIEDAGDEAPVSAGYLYARRLEQPGKRRVARVERKSGEPQEAAVISHVARWTAEEASTEASAVPSPEPARSSGPKVRAWVVPIAALVDGAGVAVVLTRPAEAPVAAPTPAVTPVPAAPRDRPVAPVVPAPAPSFEPATVAAPRFKGPALAAAVRDALGEIPGEGAVDDVDCAGSPCIVFGTIGALDEVDVLVRAEALSAYRSAQRILYRWSAVDAPGEPRVHHFALAYFDASRVAAQNARIQREVSQRYRARRAATRN